MNSFDDRLQQLLTAADGKAHAQAALDELVRQRMALESRVAELNYIRMSEQDDVDRLEARSLKGLVLELIGKREEMLEKEKAELAAAILKHDLAKRELQAVIELEYARRAELNRAEDAEAEYERLLKEKADFIGGMGGPDADEVIALRQKIAWGEAQCAELSEALRAGERALSLASGALEALDSAGTWGTIDLIGGGLISDLAKYDAMERAQGYIEKLQGQLRIFRAELADVAMTAQAEVSPDGLFRFADVFFDDIFSAISAKDRIRRCATSVGEAQKRIQKTVRELETRLRSEEASLAAAREQLRSKVIQTKV